MLVTDIEEGTLLIDNIAVLSTMQGTGLGAVLLHEAEHLARPHARAAVRLYTNEAMTANIDHYRRHGFTETHRATEDGFRRGHSREQVWP